MDTKEWPPNREAINQSVTEALTSDSWWIYRGENVSHLEKRFAQLHDCLYGSSVSNATIGLEVILKALGVGPGDEVVLPAYDFYSLPKIVLNVGAKPVFVDVYPSNPTIDVDQVANLLSHRVKAVVAVHISGAVAQIDNLRRLCDEAGAYLVEDCSQATGAMYGDKHVGSWGDAAVFSFGGVKLITCGQGGMITTSSSQTYAKCYALCNRGRLPDGSVNQLGIIGENFHLSELAACVLLPQLEVLGSYCQRREAVMRFIDKQLSRVPGLRPVEQFSATSVRAQMSYAFYADSMVLGIPITKFIDMAEQAGLSMARAHSAVASDPQLQNEFRDSDDFPAAAATQETLIRVHHTNILKGQEYWESSLERLFQELR